MSDPIDKFLEEIEKDSAVRVNLAQPKYKPPEPLSARQQQETKMWNSWDQGGRKPQDLRPLLKSMRPLIQDSVNTWKGRVRYIPDEALESEFTGHAVNAFKSYDPGRGAKLSTWVRTNLRKGGRFARTYQNVGRIVEERAGNITTFKNLKGELAEKTGRPPSDADMVRALNKQPGNKRWTPAEVQRMNSELRADIMSSTFESDPSTWSPEVDDEIMAHLGEELTPQEQQVFQHIQKPGATQGRTGLIAQKLKWSPSKVSRLRKAIESKALRYQQVLGKK